MIRPEKTLKVKKKQQLTVTTAAGGKKEREKKNMSISIFEKHFDAYRKIHNCKNMHKDLNEAMITCNHDRECSSHHAGKHRSKDTEYELISSAALTYSCDSTGRRSRPFREKLMLPLVQSSSQTLGLYCSERKTSHTIMTRDLFF